MKISIIKLGDARKGERNAQEMKENRIGTSYSRKKGNSSDCRCLGSGASQGAKRRRYSPNLRRESYEEGLRQGERGNGGIEA